MPDNLTANLSRIVERKTKLAEQIAKHGGTSSNRQDFRDAFVREIYEAFRRAGWQPKQGRER